MKYIILLIIILPFTANAQIGIETLTPTETSNVNGTIRIEDLPTHEATNAISTLDNGDPSLNPDGSLNKNQTFTATRTVVVDKNGVIGTVDGVAIDKVNGVKPITFVANNTLINGSTPVNSVTELGNLRVRFDGTNPYPSTGSSGEQSISFMLINDIKDQSGNPADYDNVVASLMKVGSGSATLYGNQQKFFSVEKDNWNVITQTMLNVRRGDFVQYMLTLINTKEIYRLTVSANARDTGSNPIEGQVTLFLERLTDQSL